jgi:hypothetical protein
VVELQALLLSVDIILLRKREFRHHAFVTSGSLLGLIECLLCRVWILMERDKLI